MLISITSNNIIEKVYLKDLSNVQHNIELGKDQPLDSGWYELCVEYVDTSIEIEDISINGSSIGQFIYTGYCTDGQGQIHQNENGQGDRARSRRHHRHPYRDLLLLLLPDWPGLSRQQEQGQDRERVQKARGRGQKR